MKMKSIVQSIAAQIYLISAVVTLFVVVLVHFDYLPSPFFYAAILINVFATGFEVGSEFEN